MNLPYLPPDDRASQPTPLDQHWHAQLGAAVNYYFYAGCDRITQSLLGQCQWLIDVKQEPPTLRITCPDADIYWYVVGNIKNIGNYLSRVTGASKIQVIPEDRRNIYFEVEVGA